MLYGKLGSSEPLSTHPGLPPPKPTPNPHSTKKRKLLFLLAFLLLLASASAAASIIVRTRTTAVAPPALDCRPSEAISRACGLTLYPNLCVSSLVAFPGALAAGERDLLHISVNLTLRRVGKALSDAASLVSSPNMDPLSRSALEDCVELLESSVDHLSRSLLALSPSDSSRGGGASPPSAGVEDVHTWLSAALTNQDTCEEGLGGASAAVRGEMAARMRDLTEIVSNCLAIFVVSMRNKEFAGIPIESRRRRRLMELPAWVGRRDRRLLQLPAAAIQADIVVTKDGNGTYGTIEEAIKAAPQLSTRRTIIYIKAGRYDETLKVGRKKTNLMFIGDGKGKTVIAGGRSIFDNVTTFHTATFAATGAGFIARDITFENWAGPAKHQAVALRVGGDHAVIYRCNVIGYQDTLYVHSQRQFFRECDIYGTVDFIFGNAAVVFQNCSLYARKPMGLQKNTITAQNRKDPNQNTGISIHRCRIVPTPDLAVNRSSLQTYLGRPWKLFSRTVYMQSFIGDHIHPRGWLEWNATFALDTLYYAEYMNYGPGGSVGQRVQWPGYRVITQPKEASNFTVAQFIYGSSWLPSTGVAFEAGLSL